MKWQSSFLWGKTTKENLYDPWNVLSNMKLYRPDELSSKKKERYIRHSFSHLTLALSFGNVCTSSDILINKTFNSSRTIYRLNAFCNLGHFMPYWDFVTELFVFKMSNHHHWTFRLLILRNHSTKLLRIINGFQCVCIYIGCQLNFSRHTISVPNESNPRRFEWKGNCQMLCEAVSIRQHECACAWLLRFKNFKLNFQRTVSMQPSTKNPLKIN